MESNMIVVELYTLKYANLGYFCNPALGEKWMNPEQSCYQPKLGQIQLSLHNNLKSAFIKWLSV